VLVAAALMVLLVTVGVATRSSFGGGSDAAPSGAFIDYAFSIFLVLFVLAIPVAIWGTLITSREVEFDRPPFLKRMIANLLSFGVAVGLVVLVLWLRRHHYLNFTRPNGGSLRPPSKAAHGVHARQREPEFAWPVLWAAIAILVPAVVAALVLHRRQLLRKRARAKPVLERSVAEDLSDSIDDAIGDLEAEPDARRAVIAAYARMENALGRHGLARRPSETPLEYLSRMLLALHVRAEAVRRLTELFERAKFSLHEIDGAMKSDAISSLRTIRDDLRETLA
jgi:hypothetical protein